jgi:hypothetical protein
VPKSEACPPAFWATRRRLQAAYSPAPAAARVEEQQQRHRRPPRTESVCRGCEPTVREPQSSAESTRSPVRSQSGNSRDFAVKAGSIPDRLSLGNHCFAGLSQDAQDPASCLPCIAKIVRTAGRWGCEPRDLQGNCPVAEPLTFAFLAERRRFGLALFWVHGVGFRRGRRPARPSRQVDGRRLPSAPIAHQ